MAHRWLFVDSRVVGRAFHMHVVVMLVLISQLACGSVIARADTVGQWNMDTVGGNNVGPGGLILYDDSTGGVLDFTSTTDFGTISLSSDTAGLMPAGTYSFDSNAGGARGFSTPASLDLHRGATGELSIEFWWKSLPPAPSLGYVMSFDGGNGASYLGDWGIYRTGTGDLRFFEYSNGFPEVGTGTAASNGAWQHVAFTIDSVGVMSSYLNGSLVTQTAATGAAAPALPDMLKFGRSTTDTFAAHHFLIDDLRISNVALVPGSGTGVGELAWNTPLSVAPVVDPRPADFGRQWVRDHPFTITSWGFTDHPTLYTDANFNATLGGDYNKVNAAGVMPMYLGALTTLNDQTRAEVQIALNAGVKAFLLRDELPISEAAGFKEVSDYIRSVDSEALIILGLGASSPLYVDQVMVAAQPDAVIHGFYPYQGATQATDQFADHLDDVAFIRDAALNYGVPFLVFIQSFDDQITSINPPNDRRRLPNESELRAEIFSKLSAGAQGIAHFVFQDGALEDIALVDPSGTKSSLYQPAADANAEVANLGKSLRYLESTDWRFHSGGVDPSQQWVDDFDTNAGSGLLDAVVITGTPQAERNALVGYFTDDDGGDYFMLVNTFHGDSLDAAAAAVDFTLTFDPSIDTVWRLNRLTGLVEELSLTNHTLNLTLPGGTGDLFKFGDGLFAGLTLLGDLNGDGFVGIADLNIVLGNWNQNVPPGDALADPSGDGFVGIADLNIVLGNWNTGTPPSGGNVPEPASLAMIGLGLPVLLKRYRGRHTSRKHSMAGPIWTNN